MKIINIINDKDATNPEDGEKIFNIIFDKIKNDENITLDFEGLDLILSTFLNSAIGQLYLKLDEKLIDKNYKKRKYVRCR